MQTENARTHFKGHGKPSLCYNFRMTTSALKLVTIYANISIAEDILDAFRALGIKFYTQFPRIVGNGPVTGPRLDSHVWPGANTGFQVVAEEALATRLMDRLQELHDSEMGRQSGLYAFQTAVERALA